jgi:hypothetical protein
MDLPGEAAGAQLSVPPGEYTEPNRENRACG